MKTLSVFFTLLFTLFLLTSLHAQTLVTYDDFNGKETQGYVNPGKWFSTDSSSLDGVIVLEDILGLKVYTLPDGVTTWNGVQIGLRAYGDNIDGGSRKNVWKQIWMPDGGNVTTMKASIQVNKFAVTGCAAPATVSNTKLRMGGAFFNTGASLPGDQTGDVYAFVGIGASSDDPKKLMVRGGAFQCNDDTCSLNTQIGNNLDLGQTKRNKRTVVRVTWDKSGGRFVFQLGNLQEQSIDLTGYDYGSGPGTYYGGGKRFQVRHELANCPSPSPRSVAGLNVAIDHIWIERSP